MNSTNRALNRGLLAVLGLASIAVAAVIGWTLVAPSAARAWLDAGRSARTRTDSVFGTQLWAGTTVSLAAVVAIAGAVVLLVLLVLLIVFIVRQGHGAASTVLSARTGDGDLDVDVSVAAALIEQRLSTVPGVARVAVSAYCVRKVVALKIAVDCRRGAAPRTIVDAIDDTVRLLGEALGSQPTVYAQLTGGFRSRLRSAVRVDTTTRAVRPS